MSYTFTYCPLNQNFSWTPYNTYLTPYNSFIPIFPQQVIESQASSKKDHVMQQSIKVEPSNHSNEDEGFNQVKCQDSASKKPKQGEIIRGQNQKTHFGRNTRSNTLKYVVNYIHQLRERPQKIKAIIKWHRIQDYTFGDFFRDLQSNFNLQNKSYIRVSQVKKILKQKTYFKLIFSILMANFFKIEKFIYFANRKRLHMKGRIAYCFLCSMLHKQLFNHSKQINFVFT